MNIHPIRAARNQRDMSQQMLADELGVSKVAVSKWEQGRSFPEPPTAFRIAKALRMKLEDVYASARAA